MAEKRTTSRRDFLKGKSAADALVGAAETLAAAVDPVGESDSAQNSEHAAQPAAEGYLVRLSRRAMACEFEMFFNAGQYADDSAAACEALDLVDELESQLSIYRESSEVSQLNRLAAVEPVVVEPRLFDLLSMAVKLSERTEGAFDITAGPLARAWGFVRRSGTLPSAATLAAARASVGSQLLELDAAERSVRYRQPGVEINLASIGKGYALDRAAALLAERGIHDFLLHGGNSSVLARGACVEAGENGWTVGLRNPLRPEQRIGSLRLAGRALATSGSGTQFFVHEGRRFGHLLDPRTGWPAEGVLSATAIAPTAAEADALSTAFFVLGPAGARRYCEEHPRIASILLCPGTRHAAVDIHVVGLTDEFEPAAESTPN